MKKARVLSIIMCVIVILSLFTEMNINVAAAPDYNLSISTGYISFGTVNQGEYVDWQTITIYNNGSETIHLIWNVSDPDGFLRLDPPRDLEIAPGGFEYFYVTAWESMDAGNYYGTLYFADASDPSYINGASVNISMTVKADAPYVNSVAVTPGNISATKNTTLRFNADVSGGNGYNSGVNWSVEGQRGNTYINSSGVLTVGQDESAQSITVKATSKQDPSIYGTATVYVTNDTYTVSVGANPSNGGAVTGGGTVSKNGSITLTASPYSGYQFVRWTENGIEIGNKPQITLSNVNSNKKIEAVFAKANCVVRATSNHSYGGTTSGDVNVAYGSDVTITANPNPGYRFDGWYENNQKVSNDKTFKVTGVKGDRTFTAMFNPNTYTVDAQISPASSGTVSGGGQYSQGSTVTLKATPNNGYSFAGWFLNGTEYSRDAQITINNISNNYSFVAYFMKQGDTTYSITSSVTSNDGAISPNGTFSVPKGNTVTYTISPKVGYTIADVRVDNVSVGAVTSYSFINVSAAHSIVASFKKIETPVDNHTGDNHSVAPSNPNNGNNNTSNPGGNNGGDANYSRELPSYNLDGETGILQKYNLTDWQALDLIRRGEGNELFEEALADGTFQISIYNELGNDIGVVQSIENADVSIINIKDVVRELLTDDDLIKILHSQRVILAFDIFDNDQDVTEADRLSMKEHLVNNMEIGKYFQIIVLKSVEGNTEEITSLNTPVTIRINVPEELKGEGRSYYIIRTHVDEFGNRTTDILADEDYEADTITFTTDKFSSYAIAYTNGIAHSNKAAVNSDKKDKVNTVGAIAFFGIAIAVLIGMITLVSKFINR